MRTKEVANICGVSIPTVTENAKKIGKEIRNGVTTDWSDDELRKLQLVLMNNTTKRGGAETTGQIVESTALNAFKGGMTLMEIVRSGNVEAMKELMDLSMTAVQETARAKELEAQNKQLQLEVDKYVQWMSASQIKKEYELPTRPGVTKVAQLLGLKRGEDWIEKSYGDDTCYSKVLYNPEAVDLIVDWYFGE